MFHVHMIRHFYTLEIRIFPAERVVSLVALFYLFFITLSCYILLITGKTDEKKNTDFSEPSLFASNEGVSASSLLRVCRSSVSIPVGRISLGMFLFFFFQLN